MMLANLAFGERNVQVATFAAWLFILVAGLIFAGLSRRYGRPCGSRSA
jgi:hypothetical protein